MSYSYRIFILLLFFLFLGMAIIARLFFWQVIAADKLVNLGKNQYHLATVIPAHRGKIFDRENYSLVVNKKAYLLYASLKNLVEEPAKIAEELTPILITEIEKLKIEESSDVENDDKKEKELIKSLIDELTSSLSQKDLVWVALKHKLSEETKEKTEVLNIKGLGFEEEEERFYPEASMAAHLIGFVGKNTAGQDTGYFGLEGFYNLELKGRDGMINQQKDASNKPILVGSFTTQEKKDGRDLILYLDRSIQFIVEYELKKAIKKYKAKSGSVIVMDPKTGGILAMTSWPTYDPRSYFLYDKSLFKNPVVSETYEPGSTFKVLVMAAAIDKGAIDPETKCDICDGELKVDKYTIKTWNEKYFPNSTMTEIIQHSDNIGMVFVGRKLGLESFLEYIEKFGIGEKTGIDLQEEVSPTLRKKRQWSEVDLATAAFGQGIAVTGIQMAQAVAAIANQGKLMEPHVVQKIVGEKKTVEIQPKQVSQVISPKTAKQITEMMVNAVEKGEVKWTKLEGYKIAGKTGTAQIPVAGHYDEEKTIASFVGFALADDPKFVMLVNLREPQSSPWGSETAAPLFFNIAKELLLYYGIQPSS